jgi:hypothetical protein
MGKALPVKGVPHPLPATVAVYEPGFTEDPEVVRDGGLCLTDGPDEVADAHLAVGRGRQY